MKFHEWRERQSQKLDDELERLASEVVEAALEVHRALGPGLPENVYEAALSHELSLRNIPHVRQVPIAVFYKGKAVGEGRIDLLVGGKLVVELKAVEQISSLHRSQVISYLSIQKLELGLLVNFNVELLRDGLKRVIKSRK